MITTAQIIKKHKFFDDLRFRLNAQITQSKGDQQ